jgi:prephenate dehydrogenase
MSNEGAREVLVVGTGLIGTSIGLALTAADHRVWLTDRDTKTAQVASDRGAGDVLGPDAKPTLIVIAVPPRSVPVVAAEYLALFPNATVTDVASVKTLPLTRLAEIAPNQLDRFVGGHPMAGREVAGPMSGRSDLFEDRLWAITPTDANTVERVADVRWLATQCGSLVVNLTPAEHDRAVALTSHAPQLLASILAAQLADADPGDVAVSGQGLRDATRLADSVPDLWAEILASNAPDVLRVLNRLTDELALVSASLERVADADYRRELPPDIAPVRSVLERGNKGRTALPDKHGGTAHDYDVIPVVVDDKPGELARLFAAAGEADVNLEDVRIEHTVGRLRAIIELDVDPASSPRLRRLLRESGWQIRG